MGKGYVHGYTSKEGQRLHDQASTLSDLLHFDTLYPAGHKVLEAGCGVGAQTILLSKHSPGALISAVDISEDSPILERAVVQSPILPKIYGFEPPSKIYDFDLIVKKLGRDKDMGHPQNDLVILINCLYVFHKT